jgi:hypothetical protein
MQCFEGIRGKELIDDTEVSLPPSSRGVQGGENAEADKLLAPVENSVIGGISILIRCRIKSGMTNEKEISILSFRPKSRNLNEYDVIAEAGGTPASVYVEA